MNLILVSSSKFDYNSQFIQIEKDFMVKKFNFKFYDDKRNFKAFNVIGIEKNHIIKYIENDFNYLKSQKNIKKNPLTYKYENFIMFSNEYKYDIYAVDLIAIDAVRRTEQFNTYSFENPLFSFTYNYYKNTYMLRPRRNNSDFKMLGRIFRVFPIIMPEASFTIAMYFISRLKDWKFLKDVFIEKLYMKMLYAMIYKFYKVFSEKKVLYLYNENVLNNMKEDFASLRYYKNYTAYIFHYYKYYIKYRNKIYSQTKLLRDSLKNKFYTSYKENIKNRMVNTNSSILFRIMDKYGLTEDDIYNKTEKYLNIENDFKRDLQIAMELNTF